MTRGWSISVVLPVYNGERTLHRAITSILAQTVPVDEIVVVDDGSTDATNELVRALAAESPGLFTVIAQSNAGASAARNAAIRAARNELVGFLDADDWWEPGKVELQVTAINERDLDVCFGGFVQWREGISSAPTILESWDETPNACLDRLLKGNDILPSTLVARKTRMLEAGLFDESMRYAGDYEFWVRMAACGNRIGYVAATLANYDRHPHSITATVHRQGLDQNLPVLDRAFASGLLPPTIERRRRWYRSHACLNNACRELGDGRNRAALCWIVKAFLWWPAAARPGWVVIAVRGLAGWLRDLLRIRVATQSTEL